MILNEVWNVYTSQKVTDPKSNKKGGNKTKRRISDDEIYINISQGRPQGWRKKNLQKMIENKCESGIVKC